MSESLPTRAVDRALALIGAVREEDPTATTAILTKMRPRDLYALAVTLAAMVPVDQSPAELLAWNDADKTPVLKHQPQGLSPHGTHAAFNRHRTNGTEPCDACWTGERDYQRGRARRRRALEIVVS